MGKGKTEELERQGKVEEEKQDELLVEWT